MLKRLQIEFDPFSHLHHKYKDDLKIVDQLIFESIAATEPLIEKIAKTLLSAGGKRLRPLLCIASADLSGSITKNSYNLAAAIELIHVATLLHDDVIDESNLRRGKKTANTLWGNKTSILVGDFLFARAFEFMVKTDNIRFLDILANASTKISRGEVAQLRCSGSLKLSTVKYLKIIEYKTATLFAAACQTGALSSGANENAVYTLHKFGKNFGLMYQILDDIFDYTHKNRGKESGDDFREGKVTLPVLLGYQADSEKLLWHKHFGENRKNSDSFNIIKNRLNSLDAFNQSIIVAQQYAQKANNALKPFNSPIKEALKLLLKSFFAKHT